MTTQKLIKVAIPITGAEEIAAVSEVIKTGNYVSGKNVAAFEQEFASYIGVSHAAAVNSGTAALHVALAVLGIGPGDEVIVPSLTFMSTVTAVLHQNAVPVFADIDSDSYCISPADIRKRLSAKTRAIIPVHLYGNAAEMDEIMDIAKEFNLFVIEDCAQAHGTEYKDRRVGSIGHLGAFSFFATKHMTTGEGGIITSNNSEWIALSKQIRSHGMVGRDDHTILGYNYRMNEMAAAMGLVQLKKLDEFNAKRIKNSLVILTQLAQHPDKWYQVPKLSGHVKHTFFWCPLAIRPEAGLNTKAVVKKLREKGIEVRHRYVTPLYRQAVILNLSPYPAGCPFTCCAEGISQNYKELFLPIVEAIAGNVIGLPNHPLLTQEEIEIIIETLINLE